jgi:hypothetical protein
MHIYIYIYECVNKVEYENITNEYENDTREQKLQ